MTNFESICLLAWVPGLPEMIIFGLVVLLLFGGAKLPGLMRNMGRSINEFKTGMSEKPQERPPKIDDESAHPKETEKSEEIVNH